MRFISVRTMLISVFLSLIFCFFVSSSVLAQELTVAADQKYLKMLEQSKTMPADFDFSALREIYPKTSFFVPYGTFVKKDVPALFRGYKNGKSGSAEKLSVYLTSNFALPEMHVHYMVNYRSMGKTDLAHFHEWASKGLAGILMTSGTGDDALRAIKVLNVSEEYLFAKTRIKGHPKQVFHKVDDRFYDVLTGPDKKSGKDISLWFDITDIYATNPVKDPE